MVKVALIGSGSLGTQIAETIFQNKQHSVVVLSRKPRPDLVELGISVSEIDYSKPETLVSALQGVHTLISVAFVYDPPTFISTQLTLIQAAKDAGVKRFAPSEYWGSEVANSAISVYHSKAEIWKVVKESGLEYTAFRPGLYMNFLAFGSTKPDVDEKVFKASPKLEFAINVATGVANIPGTGDEKLNLTTTDDIAGYVAASLDTEWAEESAFAGSVITFNELVKLAEDVTGKKFTVTYQSIEDMQRVAKEDPSQALIQDFRIAIARGQGYVEPNLQRTGYKATTAEEFLRRWFA